MCNRIFEPNANNCGREEQKLKKNLDCLSLFVNYSTLIYCTAYIVFCVYKLDFVSHTYTTKHLATMQRLK